MEENKPVKILPIGDSITQGGKKGQLEYTYRLPLQEMLLEKGIEFDFIGSRKDGLNEGVTWPDVTENVPFDPDHEGYYGYKTADVCKNVKEAFSTYKDYPDIVLIHLGTNDQKEGDYKKTIHEPLKDLILFIRQKNKKTVFLVGHLNFHSEIAVEIRDVVESLAKEMNTKNSPVKTVHHYKGWRENPDHIYTDTFDWAHPNLKGQEKMARNWFDAMKPYL